MTAKRAGLGRSFIRARPRRAEAAGPARRFVEFVSTLGQFDARHRRDDELRDAHAAHELEWLRRRD